MKFRPIYIPGLLLALVACGPTSTPPRRDSGTPLQDAMTDAVSVPDSSSESPDASPLDMAVVAVDTDGDWITDDQEGPSLVDWDRDGTPDFHDSDSDGDGISDADEAGDQDLATYPVNSDDDLIPDFRDTDSDNDGLSDSDELMRGTSPTRVDSDRDGVPDLVEIEACRRSGAMDCAGDATNAMASPRTRGDFFFFEPYMEPPSPEVDTLSFGTALQRADVYFLMDATSSMNGEIGNLQTGLIADRTGIIAQVRGLIPDARFGLGYYRDYPGWFSGNPARDSFQQSGDPGTSREHPADSPYTHVVSLVSESGGRINSADENATEVIAAVRSLSAFQGGDGPESAAPAMWAAMTGNGLSWPDGDFGVSYGYQAGSIPARTGCPMGTWGYPCFRSDAVPMIINITDAPSHNGPNTVWDYRPPDAIRGFSAPSYSETLAALAVHRTFVVGISSDDVTRMHTGTADLTAIARATGAVVDGMPLVFEVDGEGRGLSDRIVDGIASLAGALPLDIALEYVEDPGGTTRDAFVMSITPNTAGIPGRCEPHASVREGVFLGVPSGRHVCFDIRPKMNTTVSQRVGETQIFSATLRVVGISGETRTPLDSRRIFFLVPPSVREAPGPG